MEASLKNKPTSQGKARVKAEDTRYDLGIDVGSISTKVVLLRDGRNVVGRKVGPTTMEPDKLANTMVTATSALNTNNANKILTFIFPPLPF